MINKTSIMAMVFVLATVMITARTYGTSEILLSEDWDSYAVDSYPADSGWLLGGTYNYQSWPNNKVISGGPTNSGNCMQITNPYDGWGMYVQKEFDWNWESYDKLRVEVEYMYPGTNPHETGNSVDIKLLRQTDLASALSIHLDTTQTNGSDELGIWVTNGDAHQFISDMGEFDEWMHIAAEIDIDTGIYNLWANGILIGNALSINPSVDAKDIAVFHCGKGFYDQGNGYFDNILVQSSTVPEPATIALLGLGGISLIRCKLKA